MLYYRVTSLPLIDRTNSTLYDCIAAPLRISTTYFRLHYRNTERREGYAKCMYVFFASSVFKDGDQLRVYMHLR
jgi:hypothetical protein